VTEPALHLAAKLVSSVALGAPAEGKTVAAEPIALPPLEDPQGLGYLLWIPLLPLIGAVLCTLYRALGVRNKAAAWTSVALLAISFVLSVIGYIDVVANGTGRAIVTAFDWINMTWGAGAGKSLHANFSFYLDPISGLWMLFVTGLATLIALYASEYMADDVKNSRINRFYGAFCLFVFSMACLVMGDNLLLLFLGWEGVGLCSYLLIGYYHQKPSAVAAAKKAFILNRVGDVGLSLGIMFTFVAFGSLEYDVIFQRTAELQEAALQGAAIPWFVEAIPLLFMVGAFGKSAQLPLYVWLPDAMEGPTPVSALIHAATMVTAGVYLIARMLPIFALNPDALVWVAWIGGLTALLAATIGMAVFDIKRIMAYSTVSQLGYMFLGLGVLAPTGAAYHVFTHAFFKATLFLACGAVMHGFAGQLDLRKLSGLWGMKGWKVVSAAMLVGCLCLAGVPFTSGFFSKDQIIAEAFVTAGPGYTLLGLIALATAGLTAYYSFRAYFRVFHGPIEYHPGEDHHHAEPVAEEKAKEEQVAGGHAPDPDLDPHADGKFHPHAPGWAINTVLAILLVGSLLAAIPYFIDKPNHGWVGGLVHASPTDAMVLPDGSQVERNAKHSFFGLGDPHTVMYFVSGGIALLGILAAWWLHLAGRTSAAHSRADALKRRLGRVARAAENKWYVDEIYNAIFRVPLLVLANIFYLFDRLVIDGLVELFGAIPRWFGRGAQPTQSGSLQGYAAGMAAGVALLLILAWAAPALVSLVGG
jgi:NADH-quinone oxidoreductase subunit L